MSELWTPQHSKHPDVSNIFDMMLVFQEQLEADLEQEKRIRAARFALHALGNALHSQSESISDVSLIAEWMMFPLDESGRRPIIDREVGVYGLVEDIHCIQMKGQEDISVALSVDTVKIFETNDPENASYAINNVVIPIRKIKSIQTIAA